MQKQMYTFINTSGDGYWSDVSKTVLVEYISCDTTDPDYSELCVKFNTQSWNVEQDGLIYTDKLFLQELRAALIANGFSKVAAADVEYSEQGMQGNNYVSFDVGSAFIKAFNNCNLADAVIKEADYLDA